MMEYAQYPQKPQSAHSQGYSGPSNGITSPTNHSIHPHGVQTSPILPSQQQPQGQGQGHNMYPPQYGVPQQGMHYGMPQIQAAAMAATAAASGSTYPYMSSDPSLSQTSPRMAGVNAKKDPRGPRSPSQIAGQGRLGQVPSPGIPNPAMMSHGGRPGVAPPQQMQHPQSPEMQAGGAEEGAATGKNKGGEGSADGKADDPPPPAKSSGGKKRKSEGGGGAASKKAKAAEPETPEEDDDDDGEDDG